MESYREKLAGDYAVSYRVTTGETHKNTYHVHDELEVMFIKKGRVSVTVGDEKFEATDGTILLFSRIDLHAIVPHGDIFERYVIYFKPEFIETLSSHSTRLLECFYLKNTKTPNRIALSEEDAAHFHALFERICACFTAKDDLFGRDLEEKYLLGLALVGINRLYAETAVSHSAPNRKYDAIVYRTIQYIQDHLDADLTVRTLSAMHFVDKNTLCRMFTEKMNTTPSQYVMRARIVKAKQLLLDGYAVDEVCTRCGFGSLSHFSRTFKAQVGVSPSKFGKEKQIAE